MNRLLFLVFIFMTVGIGSCFAVEPSDSTALSGAKLTFIKEEVDLGIVKAGDTAEGEMVFRNDGDSPLLIVGVNTDCGCTVASYPGEAVSPGDSGVIKVKFSSKGRAPGNFRKIVRIRSNATNERMLFFVKGAIERTYRK